MQNTSCSSGTVYRCGLTGHGFSPTLHPFARSGGGIPTLLRAAQQRRHLYPFRLCTIYQPLWFEKTEDGSMKTISSFVDYARQCIEHFEPLRVQLEYF